MAQLGEQGGDGGVCWKAKGLLLPGGARGGEQEGDGRREQQTGGGDAGKEEAKDNVVSEEGAMQ